MNSSRYRTDEERFRMKFRVDEATECWDWAAHRMKNGYGVFWSRDGEESRNWLAHRFSFQLFVGTIPDGLVIDHLCRNRACVNPAHLEPVTYRENTRRGFNPAADNARKTHCVHGHEFTPANTQRILQRGIWSRRCATCNRETVARHRKKQTA